MTDEMQENLEPTFFQRWRWPLLAVAALLVFAGIGAVVQSRRNATPTPTTVSNPAINQATSAAKGDEPKVPTSQDQDRDRLTDQEEAQFGTDASKADTDGDGLYDYEELKIYSTDPKNPNTDGDGVSDGDEVKRGTNPGGGGDLRNINAAINEQQRP